MTRAHAASRPHPARATGRMRIRGSVLATLAASLAALAPLACARGTDTLGGASVTTQPFGTADGVPVTLITLTNVMGMELRAMSYGATITHLTAPDREGRLADVLLGHDSLPGFLTQSPYFGSMVGRYGNRIAKGRFTLDGKAYTLATNNAPNHLHGGVKGFDKVSWSFDTFQNDSSAGVTFWYESPDGEEGYPGRLKATVTYTLSNRGTVAIEWDAVTDAPTPVNLTQHAYFNLAGTGDVLGHELTLAASRYTPVDSTLIPTGALDPVAGTPFDFTTPHTVGERIGADDVQLRYGNGYDHNFVLDRTTPGLVLAARLRDPASGRVLEIHTTEPGVQLYSGNFLDGSITGKGGRRYEFRHGLCLETQHFPDSPNHADFPSTIVRPGETRRSVTTWTFTTDRQP